LSAVLAFVLLIPQSASAEPQGANPQSSSSVAAAAATDAASSNSSVGAANSVDVVVPGGAGSAANSGGSDSDSAAASANASATNSSTSTNDGNNNTASNTDSATTTDNDASASANEANEDASEQSSGIAPLSAADLDGRVVLISTALNGSMNIDAPAASVSGTVQALLWQNNRSVNQRFRLNRDGDYYTLSNLRTGKLLDVYGGKVANSQKIILYPDTGGLNQRWIVSANADGSYTFYSAANPKYCLDVRGGKSANGTELIVYKANAADKANQRFNLTDPPRELADGTYYLASVGSGKVVDIQSRSTKSGAKVIVYQNNSQTNQRFKIYFDDATGYYIIDPENSNGLVLDVYGGGGLGASIIQWKSNDGYNQRWAIETDEYGDLAVFSANNGLALDIYGGKDGKQEIIWNYAGQDNQRWTPVPVALPDQIVMSLTEPGAAVYSTRTLSWRVPADTVSTGVCLLAGAGPFSEQQWAQATWVAGVPSTDEPSNYGAYDHYSAVLSGLAPGEYSYRVEADGEAATAVSFTVDSAEQATAETNILYFADVQPNGSKASYSQFHEMRDLVLNARAANPETELILQGGDLENDGNNPTEWDAFFRDAEPAFAGLPLMTTAGNHEANGYSEDGYYPRYYLGSFTLPQNGPEGFKEQFYSFDYGNVHVIAVDSNWLLKYYSNKSARKLVDNWISNDLANADPALWKVVLVHHPQIDFNRDNSKKFEAAWLPIWQQAGVDLVLCGHVHNVVQTYPLPGGTADSSGFVQITGNSSLKYADGEEDPAPNQWPSFVEEHINGETTYQVITATPSTLTVETHAADGRLLWDPVVLSQ
jgi:predicted MPP superfamily phosphohydrolase